MKNIKFLTLLFIGLLAFNACQDDDSLTYIAEPSGEFAFTNTFLSEYTLTTATAGNIGERFTWNDADFGVQTNVTYELQKSITGDFTDMEILGTTESNSYTLTIGDLLDYAAEAGLDNDPATENPDTGSVSFRLRAFVGTAGSTDITSAAQALTLVLPEATGSGPVCEFDLLYGVGAGLPDAGWAWTSPNTFSCIGNGVYGANINLKNAGAGNDSFRFFTADGDWASGRNYPWYADAGYTIDANLTNAGDGDSNFAFVGTDGYYYLEIDDTNKTITLDSPQSYGNCEFEVLYGVGAGLPDAGWAWTSPVILNCTGEGVYTAFVSLQNNGGADNNFRFFTSDGDWASGRNYPWYADAGYTIDSNFANAMDGDSNFAFIGTSGTYFLTIDDTNLTITLE